MLLAIINTFLWSLSSILWKKSLELNKLSQRLFMFLDLPIGFLVAIILILFWYSQYISDYRVYFGIILIIVISINIIQINQFLYKNEKMSVLIPYDNLDKIFTIILGFLFFKNSSLVSFLIAILSVFVILGFTIDFKNFKLPKRFLSIVIRTILVVFKNILLAFIIVKINTITFFSYNTIFNVLILLGLILYKKEYSWIKTAWVEFYKYRFSAAIIWQLSAFISLFLLETQWLVIANLLGFLGIGITLLFGFIVLKDRPNKKDLTQAIIICILVWIGYFLK